MSEDQSWIRIENNGKLVYTHIVVRKKEKVNDRSDDTADRRSAGPGA